MFVIKRLRKIYDFHHQIAFLIDTNLIQATHFVLISERRGSIVTSPRTKFTRRDELSRIESKRVCTTRGGNDRHRRNRTERESRKGGEGEKKPKRDSAERDEGMKASGFVEGLKEEGERRGRVRVDADIAVGQVRFCLNGESGYRMIHIVRAPFEPLLIPPRRRMPSREHRTNLDGRGGELSPSCQRERRRDSVKAEGGGSN